MGVKVEHAMAFGEESGHRLNGRAVKMDEWLIIPKCHIRLSAYTISRSGNRLLRYLIIPISLNFFYNTLSYVFWNLIWQIWNSLIIWHWRLRNVARSAYLRLRWWWWWLLLLLLLLVVVVVVVVVVVEVKEPVVPVWLLMAHKSLYISTVSPRHYYIQLSYCTKPGIDCKAHWAIRPHVF